VKRSLHMRSWTIHSGTLVTLSVTPTMDISNLWMLQINSWFFSHSIKIGGSLLSAVTVSLHYLPRRHSAKRLHRNLKRAFEDLLLYYCYAKNNSRKIRSQTWPRKGAHMNELQAHYCMTQNSEPGSCAACHTDKYADTARIPQVIRFKLLTSGFLENFGS